MTELKTASTEMVNPELAQIEFEGQERSDFLLKGAMAAGAIFGLGAISPFVRNAVAKADMGDVEILNYALTLEYLESAFYKEAKTKVKGSSDLMELINTLSTDEDAHVKAITGTIKSLGGKPVKAPKVSFPYTDAASFVKLATTIEDTGVSAYNGVAPQIKSKDVLTAAGSIVQVEARHAAAMGLQNGTSPAPNAFDPTLTQAQVLKAVTPFLVS